MEVIILSAIILIELIIIKGQARRIQGLEFKVEQLKYKNKGYYEH